MNSADEFDPLADLLGKRAADQADAALRESAFVQTLPVLRRRRFVRRAGWAAAFAACYLAGLTTTSVWQHAGTNWQHAAAKPPREVDAPAGRDRPPAAEAQLAQRPKTPFEQLRDAGNEAWRRQADIEAAIQLYAQAIEVATPEELRISATDDNWLLIALKQDHIQEKQNVEQPDES